MPKPDRAAQMKKDASKTAKKVSQEAQAAQKAQAAAPTAPAAQEAAGRGARQPTFPSGKKQGMVAGNSSFAKAAVADDDDYDDEYEQAEVPEQTYEPQEKASKKETASSKKKQPKATYKDDMQLLLEEQQAARRQRIMQRLLRIFVVGFVQELREGQAEQKKETKPLKKKGGKTNGDDHDSGMTMKDLRQKADVFGGPLLMLAFMVLLIAARLGEEGYKPDHRAENEANFYDVMGVSSDASMIQIRKAYKGLALSWHPDKNPTCEDCAERFEKISKAYETLSSPERRKAYDERRAPEGSLDTMTATELTAEDFEHRVLRSNEVWIVQIYDPNDGLCQHFHPIFEDIANSHQHIARFGRINAMQQRQAMSLLPQRVVMMPVVFRFARGHEPEILLWQRHSDERTEEASRPFARFVLDHYPSAPRLTNSKEVQDWWASASERPRLIVAGPGRPRTSTESLGVQRIAHMWSEFVSFATTDAKNVQGAGLGTVPGNQWSVISSTGKGAGERTTIKSVKSMADVTELMKEAIAQVVAVQAPSVTLRNHHQLCSPGSLTEKRAFCLMLVDASEQSGAAVLNDLNVSLSTYHQELQDLVDSSEESGEGEEQLHIQPVRIMTSSSRMPWNPAAAGYPFYSMWNEAGRAQAFLLELETRRVAPVKGAHMRDLYQAIAYEDLKFKGLPEEISITAAFPDPETSLHRELHSVLATLPGGIAAFLLAAVAYAVVPELPLLATAAFAVLSAGLVMVSWPAACRRFIMLLWCTVSAASYECRL